MIDIACLAIMMYIAVYSWYSKTRVFFPNWKVYVMEQNGRVKSGTIFSGVSYLIESLQELFSGATFKLEDEGIEKKKIPKIHLL